MSFRDQINLGIKTTTAPGTPAPGEPDPLPGELSFTIKPGLLVKHYSYDGLGRLIRTQSPWPDVQEGAVTKQVRSERFFYDGIRRIQELVTDPVLNKTAAMTTGDPGLIELAEAEGEILGENEEALEGEFVFDGDTTSLKLEDGQSAAQGGGSGSGSGGSGGGGGGSYVLLTYLAREYIWGPGDSHAGVDELLVYFNHNRWAYWPLQDAGGDIVSVCDMGGTNPAGGNAARVCGQWRYDAYGAATAAEHLAAFPQLHCGHKALFFDRLDIGVDPGAQGIEPPRLIPFAHLLVHMRNRAYSPQMGRFMQPDPNATALTLIEAASYHGRGMDAMVAAFDMQGMYGDGMNLYEYLGSSPWGRSDPLGLFNLSPAWPIDPQSYWERQVEGLETAFNAAATFTSFADAGGLIGAVAQSLIDNYAANMEADADWAMDWSLPDDWHSRNSSAWVQESMLAGAYNHFNLDPWMGSGSGGGGPVMAGMIQQTLTRAGKVVRKGHLHHAVPRYLVKFFKSADEVVVRMPVGLHQKYHKGLDTYMRQFGFPAMNQRAKWKKYMEDNPGRTRSIKKHLREFTAKFEKKHKLNGLLDAIEETFP
jgi:hypothetical protein